MVMNRYLTFPKFQGCSLNVRYSLVSYPWLIMISINQIISIVLILIYFLLILINWIQLMGHTSADRDINGTDLVGCVPSSGLTSSLRGPSPPQALKLLGGVRFIAWRLRRSFSGEFRRDLRHIWKCTAGLGYGSEPRPTLKRPCTILGRLVGRPTNTVLY